MDEESHDADSLRQSDKKSGTSIPDFIANGSRIIYDGWLKADPESSGEEVTLPKCAKGEKLDLRSIDAIAKQTQPPARYTEAGLIKELEKRGIGRPSTYASIIKTIEDRQGLKVACIEEIAYTMGYINKKQLAALGR